RRGQEPVRRGACRVRVGAGRRDAHPAERQPSAGLEILNGSDVRHLPRIPPGLGRWLVVAVSVAFAGPLPAAEAQTATAPALKAAYLYNFAKFTTWPGGALGPAEPLVLCVVNDRAVNDALASLTKDRSIEGHALVVRGMKHDSPALSACRILFVA